MSNLLSVTWGVAWRVPRAPRPPQLLAQPPSILCMSMFIHSLYTNTHSFLNHLFSYPPVSVSRPVRTYNDCYYYYVY